MQAGKEEIDIAAKKNLISRQRKIDIAAKKNRYRCEEKLIIASKKKSILQQRKIDIAAKKNRLSHRRKNRYCGEGKSISPRRKIDYCIEEKIDIAAKEESAVAESSYRTQAHHLRGEQKRKLCLLERLSTELSEASSERQKVWSKDLFLMTSSIKGTDRPIPPSTRDLVP